ncbi:MAG: GNAT family N-acetyltransferase [Mycobacteriaceae bacterium]
MRHQLSDGAAVRIRPVQPSDAALLADGFARLSIESRELRFLTRKSELTESELRYFTEVDHRHHEALGAVDEATGRGIGIARFVKHTEEPKAAELAIVIDDDWQGRGLGTALLSELTDRAREEGIRRFTALVAADNSSVLGLLQTIGDGPRSTHRDYDTIEYEVDLGPAGLGEGLRGLLRAFGCQQLKPPPQICAILNALVPSQLLGHDD